MYDMSGLEQMEEMAGASAILYLISVLPSLLIGVATYIVVAYALYSIASRRGISKPWLAWIPVASAWTLGAISDDYRLKAKCEKKSRRKILLGINIALCVLLAVVLAIAVVMVVGLLADMDPITGEIPEDMVVTAGLGAAGVLLLWIPMMVLAIIQTVFSYIALYDVYRSCDPGNAVLYLVLSIFINICQPVFLFLSRNKDDGMPKPQPEIPPAVWPSEEKTEEEN